MYEELLENINCYIKVHYSLDYYFAGVLLEVKRDRGIAILYNETGKAKIIVQVNLIVAITVVQNRVTVPTSPHYRTQLEDPYFENKFAQDMTPPGCPPAYSKATVARMNKSAYRRR